MSLDDFLRFCAFLLFAMFNLYWSGRFVYAKYRWVPFLLTCLGVLGAMVVLVDI